MIIIKVTGRPVPWQRAGRRGNITFTAPKTREYQKRIRDSGKAVMLRTLTKTIDSPVKVWLWVSLPLKKDGTERNKRFDLDNMAKTWLDGMQTVVFKDDRQVIYLEVQQIKGTQDGECICKVEAVDDDFELPYLEYISEIFGISKCQEKKI